MESPKRFKYHKIAKQMGVPNIILTGIEKEAKMEFPDDDEMYACHVLKKLKAMSEEPTSEWSKCDIEEGDILPVPNDFIQK